MIRRWGLARHNHSECADLDQIVDRQTGIQQAPWSNRAEYEFTRPDDSAIVRQTELHASHRNERKPGRNSEDASFEHP
jgi:hypothetical protein